jgi:hypothetical protein
MLRAMLARERVRRGEAVLVEDSRVNLKAARESRISHRAADVTWFYQARAAGRGARASYVDLRIGSMHQLARHVERLRR